MQLPRSVTEEFLGVVTSQIALPLKVVDEGEGDEDISFYYYVHQLTTSLQAFDKSEFEGAFNSLSVIMPSSPCSGTMAAAECATLMFFPKTEEAIAESEKAINVTKDAFVTAKCLANGDPAVLPLQCPYDQTILVQCNGTEAEITVQCPNLIHHTGCSSKDTAGLQCELIDENDDSITCSCMLPLDNRRLLSTNGTSGGDATISVSYVAMVTSTMTTFTTTIVSAQALDASIFKTGWQVILTLGGFIGFICLAVFVAVSLDIQEEVPEQSHHHGTKKSSETMSPWHVYSLLPRLEGYFLRSSRKVPI
jgi:hypothetical protein